MAYEVEEPIEEQCFLTECDPSKTTWVTIRQGRGGQDMQRDQLWAEFALERDEQGKVKLEHYKMPGTKAIFVEAWLTFIDSNIILKRKKRDQRTGKPITDDEGKPIYETVPMFKAGMSQSDFEARFSVLPREVIREWHGHVRRLNPDWDPEAQAEIAKN